MKKFILFLGIYFFSFSVSAAAVEAPAFDIKKLKKTCESSWSAYQKDFEALRESTARYVKTISEQQFEDRFFEAGDPLLMFVAYTWPQALESVHKNWKAYGDCAQKHVQLVRLHMTDRARPLKEEVQQLQDCWQVHTSAGKSPLPSPLAELISCYQSQAKSFKE